MPGMLNSYAMSCREPRRTEAGGVYISANPVQGTV